MTSESPALVSTLRQALQRLPHLPRALALVWSAARLWTLSWLVLIVIQGLLPVAVVFLARSIVDRLAALFGTEASWEATRPLLLLVALMAAVLLLAELLRALGSWIRIAQSELVRDHLSSLIHAKSVEVDLAFYDLPDYYDHLYRARSQSSSRSLELIENLGSLLQNGLTLLAMATVLVRFGLWLPMALLLSTIPALLVALRFSLEEHQWSRRTTENQRRTLYYDWVMTSVEHAAEVRLFQLGDRFRKAFQGVREMLRGERMALAKRRSLAQFLAAAFGLLVTGLSLGWMIWETVQGTISLGDLALFYAAFTQGQRLMRSLLEQAGNLYFNLLFLGDLFEFLELTPGVVEAPAPSPLPERSASRISFENVSFAYPGSPRPVLADFDLEIPAGVVAALVGPNGAGKSTLLKLLCRFYDPDRGAIRIGDVDIREFSLTGLRRQMTTLFQQPVHYSATAAENITISRPESAPDREATMAASHAAGAHSFIARLPEEYETLLGKWFSGGAELSVGEWQRLALARAFFRQAPIILLDEPTSSMDSWAEAAWMDRFRELAVGRTSLVITHRFSTAQRADVIHVMRDGQICESGTHRELMEAGGTYRDGWSAQLHDPPSSQVERPSTNG